MKEQVENLLKKGKEQVIAEQEQIIASNKQKRDNHLKSLGLVDEGEVVRTYYGIEVYGSKYDEEKKKYYTESQENIALDVTDEEYAEICKYFPPELATNTIKSKTGQSVTAQSTDAETTLKVIAQVVLWVGIVLSIILFIAGIAESPVLLLGIPIILLPSIVTWAFTKVFSNISLTLKEINEKTR